MEPSNLREQLANLSGHRVAPVFVGVMVLLEEKQIHGTDTCVKAVTPSPIEEAHEGLFLLDGFPLKTL